MSSSGQILMNYVASKQYFSGIVAKITLTRSIIIHENTNFYFFQLVESNYCRFQVKSVASSVCLMPQVNLEIVNYKQQSKNLQRSR